MLSSAHVVVKHHTEQGRKISDRCEQYVPRGLCRPHVEDLQAEIQQSDSEDSCTDEVVSKSLSGVPLIHIRPHYRQHPDSTTCVVFTVNPRNRIEVWKLPDKEDRD